MLPNLKRMGIRVEELGIPLTVFENPVTLIPAKEMDRWFERLIEQSKDPDVVLAACSDIELSKMGLLGRWVFSCNDLALILRRLSFGLGCLQSGAFFSGKKTRSFIKWAYTSKNFGPSTIVHESIRMAILMHKVLTFCLGKSFASVKLRLPGQVANSQKYESYFGCEIEWNQPCIEFWINANYRFTSYQVASDFKAKLAMSTFDLEELLNMPDPEDELKVIYEVINYARHFGLPKVSKVAYLLDISEQQLYRVLQHHSLNFSTLTDYVLSNLAVEYLKEGMLGAEIASRLGYSNEQSFERMFKRNRGITPKQFQKHYRIG